MPIYEKSRSRSQTIGPDGSVELMYGFYGDEDDAVVRLATEAALPAFYAGLVFQDYRLEPLGAGFWDITARYGKRAPLLADEPSSLSWSFDTTGGTQRITQSLETVASYAPEGDEAPDFHGAIGVNGDRIEGAEIPVPDLQLTITARFSAARVTLEYLATLYRMKATVNNAIWKGFPKGELLFLGAIGSQRGSEDPEISFKFLGSANQNNLTVGDIAGIEKEGHQYLWVLYEDDVDSETLVKVPRAAYVEKVFDYSDFSALGLGS